MRRAEASTSILFSNLNLCRSQPHKSSSSNEFSENFDSLSTRHEDLGIRWWGKRRLDGERGGEMLYALEI